MIFLIESIVACIIFTAMMKVVSFNRQVKTAICFLLFLLMIIPLRPSQSTFVPKHLEECFVRFMNQLEERNVRTHYDMAYVFFRFWQMEEKEFLSTLLRSGLSVQLMERFYYYLELFYQRMEKSQSIVTYVRSFLAGGLYKLLVDWIKHDRQVSIEELAEFLSIGRNILFDKFSK